MESQDVHRHNACHYARNYAWNGEGISNGQHACLWHFAQRLNIRGYVSWWQNAGNSGGYGDVREGEPAGQGDSSWQGEHASWHGEHAGHRDYAKCFIGTCHGDTSEFIIESRV